MRLFIDANILVAVLNKEYPVYPQAAKVLSLSRDKRTILITSSICLAIAFYFAEKKHGYDLAKSKMAILARHLEIADCGSREVEASIANKKVTDFEEGLEYYTALHAKCNYIITSDLEDFYFSELEVLEPGSFLREYCY